MNERVVPVFPLPLVACPGEPVALHIFEERYKTLIADCRHRSREGAAGEFLIVFLDGDNPVSVGSSVVHKKTLKTYEDGRLDIVALGKRRCRLLEWVEGAPYRQARVEPLPDEETDWDEDLANRVFQDYRDLTRMVMGFIPKDALFTGKPGLSYQLVPTSGLTHPQKQRLLEMRSENDRLRYLGGILRERLNLLPDLLESLKTIQLNWRLHDVLTEPVPPE